MVCWGKRISEVATVAERQAVLIEASNTFITELFDVFLGWERILHVLSGEWIVKLFIWLPGRMLGKGREDDRTGQLAVLKLFRYCSHLTPFIQRSPDGERSIG